MRKPLAEIASELMTSGSPQRSVARPECPACSAPGPRVFYEMEDAPVQSCVLLETRQEAMDFPTGRIRLGLCETCGFISNLAFEPDLVDYTLDFEETQGFSPTFNRFAEELARDLVERHDLRNKRIFEIGCGKGEFLALLCEIGPNDGIGVDPSWVPGRISRQAAERIDFIRDYFDEEHYRPSDLVCCRHTLEHIPATRAFVERVRRSIGDERDTMVFFDVPDVLRVLEETAFWDVYYEHASYFSLGSLARLFRRTGFEVLDLHRYYDDQWAVIEARPDGTGAAEPHPREDDLATIVAAADDFATRCRERIAEWRGLLGEAVGRGERAVIWGAGSKGVAFLTTLGIRDEVEYAVDINPFKQGRFMPGTGQQVVGPEFLEGYRPDLVVAMNPIYRDEIQADLDRLGVHASLEAV